MRFTGKTVVVTGVGQAGQVGAHLAHAFGGEGARVLLVGRTADDVEARTRELATDGIAVASFAADLADPARVAALADELRAAAGDGIDALVNAAGGFAATGPVRATEPDAWQRQLTINLATAFLTTRALLPLLRLRRGAIVYFASVAALPGATGAGTAAYAAAKSGVLALMRAVAAEEGAAGVRANAVAPSAIDTAANAASGMTGPMVSREAVADTVLYLCSDAARAVTGQTLRLG